MSYLLDIDAAAKQAKRKEQDRKFDELRDPRRKANRLAREEYIRQQGLPKHEQSPEHRREQRRDTLLGVIVFVLIITMLVMIMLGSIWYLAIYIGLPVAAVVAGCILDKET